MKRSWQTEELIENWTLIPTELDLLKVGGGREIKRGRLYERFFGTFW